jgi:hypothetical protein
MTKPHKMNSIKKALKKGKHVPHSTGTVTGYQTVTNKAYIIGICTLAITAPFVHIPIAYLDINNQGIAGYKYMTYFLLEIGWPTTLICAGLLFKYAKRYSFDEAKHFFKLLSLIFIILGIYFLSYALIPMPSNQDLPVWAYFTLLGICSVMVGFMIYALPDANAKLKGMIRFWMAYLINDIPKKLPEDAKADYYKELNRKMEESL